MDKKVKEILNMNLAEKIFNERKRLGLSQEQFAEQMEVSRQAVSKWESGQSMPDLDKIVLMSQIFGVSTDYLLKKEEAAFEQNREAISEEAIKRLSKEEVEGYQKIRAYAQKWISAGVSLILFGVILMLLIEMAAKLNGWEQGLVEDGIMPSVLFVCVAIAVGMFVSAGMKLRKYSFLKEEEFLIPEEIKRSLEEEYEREHEVFVRKMTIGVVLCVIGIMLCVLFSSLAEFTGNEILEDSIGAMALIGMIAIAVHLFVSSGMRQTYYQVLLQKQDYQTSKKRKKQENNNIMEVIAEVYWCIVSAVFLGYSLITNDWGRSWIVWPVAGCLFGAISVVITLVNPKSK